MSKIRIGDVVEIRNQYQGYYRVSRYIIKGKVIKVTLDTITLKNEEIGREYKQSKHDLVQIIL